MGARERTDARELAPGALAERLTAQLIAGAPARDPEAVAERLLAIQAQDARGARLAIRARTAGLTAAHVDRALTERRSLVVSWLNRGTLHLVRSEDYGWLHALTAPPSMAANARRLAQEGVDERAGERGVAAIERALSDEGPLPRERLRERVASAGVRVEGQALVHVLMRAALLGAIVRGPVIDGRHAYALVRDWLGEPAAVDRDRALAELAARYLRGHAPASDRDLARWAGIALRDARAGLRAIAGRLRERADGLLEPATRPAPAQVPAPRLLGAFDPVLLGWRDRAALLGDHEHRVVSGGMFRAFALVDGRAAATWRLAGREVELDAFRRLTAAQRRALDAEAADVRRFLGGAA